MSSKTLFRLSGLALLLSFPFQIISWFLHPPSHDPVYMLTPHWVPAHVALLVAWVFVLFGLMGMYARQAHRAGILGLIGFLLTMVGGMGNLYFYYFHAFVTPVLAKDEATQSLVAPSGVLADGRSGMLAGLLVLGILLFGIATVRAGVLPRWAGLLQIASFPVFMAFLIVPPEVTRTLTAAGIPEFIVNFLEVAFLLAFLGYTWAGYALWAGKGLGQKSPERSVPSQPLS